MSHIVIISNLTTDLVIQAPTIPQPGQTVQGETFEAFPGGKGINQAVAAVRLGATVTMIGRIGADAFGERLLANLHAEGIDVGHIHMCRNIASGVKLITTDDEAQRSVVSAPGANKQLSADDIRSAWKKIKDIDTLLLTLEIPPHLVKTAMQLAQENDVDIVLNPAPVRPLPDNLWQDVDVLIVNESEATFLSDLKVKSVKTAAEAADRLLTRGVGMVAITMAEKGMIVLDGRQAQPTPIHVPSPIPPPTKISERTGADDVRVAAFALGLAKGRSPKEAAVLANAIASIPTAKAGTQPAMPTYTEIDQYLAALAGHS